MKIGVIYKVTIGDNFIFGSSLTPKKRENEYRRDLERNLWNNPYVQNSYNKNKKDGIKFEIVQKNIPENILEHIEDIWIGANCSKIYDNKGGMNIRDAFRSKLSEEGKKKLSIAQSIKIYEYDLEGNFVKEWSSLTEAAKYKNAHTYTMIKNAKGKANKSGESMWRYDYYDKVPPYVNTIGKAGTKKIIQRNLDGSFVKEWSSAMEATSHGFNNTCIGNVCLGKQDSYKGFKWEFEKPKKKE